MIKKKLFLYVFFLCAVRFLDAISLAEQFRQVGYVEICNKRHGANTFDHLYVYFDELIEFLQKNPVWIHKLYQAKERFIRSKNKNYYSTDFFGFYDESQKKGRGQISFYYSTHFHEFVCFHYPEFNQIPEVIHFFESCYEIQESYKNLFSQAAIDLGVDGIFSSEYGYPPILFKVVKYFPSYVPVKPHYDGTAFSLFLDSTDNESLLFSVYKPSLKVNDFFLPVRQFIREMNQSSILLIPGTLLTEFSIYPTPHIVIQGGKTRYATIAFAMRPNHISKKQEFYALPSFIVE